MKTKIIIFTLSLFTSIALKAQEVTPAGTDKNSNDANRKFGLGVKTFNLTNELIESPIIMPGNKIILTINPHKNIRLQPEAGYVRGKEKNANYKDGLITKAFSAGCGVFGLWQKEKTNLYAGLKYIYSNNEDEYLSYTGTNYLMYRSSSNTNAYGVVLGGEYMFAKHFSFGCEAGFLRCTSTATDTYPGSSAQEVSFLLTDTNLLVRFYF